MKDRPILFSTPMVKAILDGRKTQTRRVIKNVTDCYYQSLVNHTTGKHTFIKNDNFNTKDDDVIFKICPYGEVGDLLWVRESFKKLEFNDRPATYLFKANPENKVMKWKPSIHMPKEAARIWLKITNVRVERLHDISEEDAKAEGVESEIDLALNKVRYKDYDKSLENIAWSKATDSFMSLWTSINGAESWIQNPFVWVVEFEVLSTTGKPQEV